MTASSNFADSHSLNIDVQWVADESSLQQSACWEQWAVAALTAASAEPRGGEITIRIVGNDESRALNEGYRDKAGPTNVLAFPAADDLPDFLQNEVSELGDLVICLPVVIREAEEQGKSPVAHLAHMAVHGTLHLLGYDHISTEEAEEMEALEVKALESLNIANPYSSL